MADAPSTIWSALIGAVAGLTGAVAAPYITGKFGLETVDRKAVADISLAQQKFYSDLIMKAIEPPDQNTKIDMLNLLSKTNIIPNPEVRAGINALVKEVEEKRASLPTAPRAAAEGPATASRIYLLAGTTQRGSAFSDMQKYLRSLNLNVIGAKTLVDSGRPDQPEIRFFNSNRDDEQQARQLAETLQSMVPNGQFTVKGYEDDSVKPGYIEVWLGR